ncbi:MAG: sulfite exporter TauE/SafE family protein [Bacteroidetes bacterium]|nr:sulfite exporter TauE/SafE family protein [Bacteroidota bacterium]
MDIYQLVGFTGALLTGLVLGLLGGGGALLSIPVLVYLFHLDASVATGYSLFLVAVTASIGAVQNIRKQMVDYHAALYYGIPSVITVYVVRRFVMPNLPDVILTFGNYAVDKNHFILFLLAIVMMGAGYKMFTAQSPTEENFGKEPTHFIMLMFYAVLIGCFLGLVGAGGGFLMIPALVYLAHLPMKKAVGTSLVLVALNSSIGFLGDIHSNQNMDWKFLLAFSAFSVTGVFTGFYLHRFTDGHKLKKYFGGFMMLMAIFIVMKETLKNL